MATKMWGACVATHRAAPPRRLRAGLRRRRPVPARSGRRARARARGSARSGLQARPRPPRHRGRPGGGAPAVGADLRDAIGASTTSSSSTGLRCPPLDAIDCLEWDADALRFRSSTWATSAAERRGRHRPTCPDDYVLATVGGGSDGFAVLATFIEALRLEPLPCPAVVVTGPLMARERRRAPRGLAAGSTSRSGASCRTSSG